jgi:tetratricopeptide (TPR) repeat protein
MDTIRFPKDLRVAVADVIDGTGVPGILVDLVIRAPRKNDYTVYALTDISGVVNFSRSRVEQSLKNDQRSFPRDFVSMSLDECPGLTVEAPPGREIQRRIESARKYGFRRHETVREHLEWARNQEFLPASLDLNSAQQTPELWQVTLQLRRIEEPKGTLRTSDERSIEPLAQVAGERTALSAAVQECEQRLTAVAARLDADTASGAAQREEWRRLIEQVQAAQGEVEAAVRATAERAVAQAEEAMRSIEELKTAQRAHDEHTTRIAARQAGIERLTVVLAERVGAAEAAVAASRQPIENSAARVVFIGRPPVRSLKSWLRPTLVVAGLLVASVGTVAAIRWQGTSIERSLTSRGAELPPPASTPQRSLSARAFESGVEALSRGDLAAAAQVFDDLAAREGGSAEVRNNLAVALAERGQIDAAAEQLRRALELRPDYERARLNLERLQALRAAR